MRPTNRLAFTLIALLVVMTAGVTVLTVAIGMIQRTMKIASINQARMDQSLVIDRLAREFRHDAHRAVSFNVNQGIEFSLADGSTILYRNEKNGVARTEFFDDQPTANERFQLGESQDALFSSPQPNQVRLEIQTSISQSRTHRSIQSVVGRWMVRDANHGDTQ